MTAAATEPGSVHDRSPSSPRRADQFMLTLLRLPAETGGTVDGAQTAFQKSIVVSALRCLITYIFLPFVAPFWGLAVSIGEPLGIVVALVAMASIIMSTRRFWRSRHPKRWAYTILGGLMMCFLVFLLATDISRLL